MLTIQKFTGLKYDDDAGWYAVRNGRIVCPSEGISGMLADAERALAWASIDWYAVEPLAEADKCVDENPAYLSILF